MAQGSLDVMRFTFMDRFSLTALRGVVNAENMVQGFTITVAGLSGANTMRAVRDILDRPADAGARSRFFAALALCCGQKSTEGVEYVKLTPIQRV